MDTVFAWKKIEDNCFKKEISFSYGESIAVNNIISWDCIYEDLYINVSLYQNDNLIDPETYLMPEETAGIVLTWFGDGKFIGSSEVYPFDFENSIMLNCTIPKGFCSTSLNVECNIIILNPITIGNEDWARPPGSILAEIPIIDNTNIGKGNWFPIEEYEGNGSTLIRWEFINTDNLDVSISSSLLVLIDTKHPLYNAPSEGSEVNFFIDLMIIQAFARKAFTESIFNQLTEREEKWNSGSLGASFYLILNKLCSYLNTDSMPYLKEIYHKRPEKIDEIIDLIFSKGITTGI